LNRAWSRQDDVTDMRFLCRLTDFPKDGKYLVVVDGKDLLVIQTSERIYAVSNICPHAGGKLIKGRVDGGTITCIEHGLCFDLKSGAMRLDAMDEDLLEMMGNAQSLPFGPLKTYEIVVGEGSVFLVGC